MRKSADTRSFVVSFKKNFSLNKIEEADALLPELVVKRSLEKNKIDEVIKRESLRGEIISNAESFKKFKDKIRKVFSKEEYLKFLLNLRNPVVSEMKKYVDKANKRILYDFIDRNADIIKNLAKAINDKTLIFSVAVYEKDFDAIISNFNQFDKALKVDYKIGYRLKNVVDLFVINKFKEEEIAKKLLTVHVGAR